VPNLEIRTWFRTVTDGFDKLDKNTDPEHWAVAADRPHKTFADRVINSRWLLVAARLSMVIIMPIIAGGVGFVGAQTKSLNDTVERVTVLETRVEPLVNLNEQVQVIKTRIDEGQKAREQFQNDTTDTLQEIRKSLTTMIGIQSALVARLDEQDRAADRAAKAKGVN
jgi:TolA-binding protein